ncbi:MAG: transporter permease, partial [Daejeonella sp.]|nr:transporter permease [Daejeonella sp.]
KGNAGKIRLGSKIFGEQYILSNIYKMLIMGYTDLQVETKTGLGGTKICFEALANNQIDMYPEYTGTGLLVILQPDGSTLKNLKSKEDVYSYVKKEFDKRYKITWLKPIGFNNAYAIMMRRQQAKELKLKSITDLAEYLKTH